jgi:spore germination protein KC
MEIDRISFPVALGIDFDEASNSIKVYAQISKTSSSPGGQPQTQKTFKVIEGQGDTLRDAMESTVDRSSQNISWKHITTVVITNKMAAHGIGNELDLLCRFQQIHMNCYLMLTNVDLKELLESTPKIESSLPSPLAAIQLISEQSSYTKAITIRDFVMAYLCNGTQPIISNISIIKGEGKEITVDYVGLGVFKKDKLIGYLSEYETKGANWIFGTKNTSSATVPYSENGEVQKLTISSITTKPKIISSVQQNTPSITVQLETEYNLSQNSIRTPFDTIEADKINKQVELYIKQNVEAIINKTQKELHSDIFGFGAKIYRKYPKYWLENKDKWNDIFPNIAVNVQVKASLKNTGELLNSLEYSHGED